MMGDVFIAILKSYWLNHVPVKIHGELLGAQQKGWCLVAQCPHELSSIGTGCIPSVHVNLGVMNEPRMNVNRLGE